MNARAAIHGAALNPLRETAPDPLAGKVRVMIVDDSLTVRTIFKRMVEGDPDMAVVGTASSAERAIAQLRTVRVDVVLLDLEMPGMGGLDALPALLETGGGAQVLVVSSLTQDGAVATVAALSMGAADTMLKPRPGGFNDEYRSALLGKIRALGNGESSADAAPEPIAPPRPACALPGLGRKAPEVVAIGASTGGIHALNRLLRSLPPEFSLPLVITQHLPASFVPVFARQIESAGARPTLIAEDGAELRRGTIAIAPGHGHVVVHRIGERLITRISTEPAASGCMPSVDPMLASLAQACEGQALGVLLSGMGRDGAEGAQALVASGGTVFAQDAASSAVWGMPGAVAKAGLASVIAPPEQLSEAIARLAASAALD